MKKKDFLSAVDTLKLYRRAELLDSAGQKIVGSLYVDPLAEEHVLKTVLKPNTTFLIGRKGTGKSTIFQSAQDRLDQDHASTWAYIDIKTLFESSTSELITDRDIPDGAALPPNVIKRLLVYRHFIAELVREIKTQIDARVSASIWERIKARITGSKAELFESLDEFLGQLDHDDYVNATAYMKAHRDEEFSEGQAVRDTNSFSATASATPHAEAQSLSEIVRELEQKKSQNYAQVFVRVFGIRQLIKRLCELLRALKIRHLYIFVDDFSELPKRDMEEIVDSILAPFNNWSDEFIKLKVAIYPGRLYLGGIDRSKVDEVYLDIYRAYGRSDVSEMEVRAIDFTKRLVSTRVQHFCKSDVADYFDGPTDDLWRELFYASIGNPRILGYVLYYCYETHVAYDKKITIRGIRDAARRYYDEKLVGAFRLSKFLHETFDERSSIYSLRELLEEIVKRAKKLRTYTGSNVIRELSGRPPTSHFHVTEGYEPVLSTLELNFFITKYYEMKDRDGRDVSVYALNNGLCQQEAIAFGRPMGKREHRLYFVERIFDYSPLIVAYVRMNQEIVCNGCGVKHSFEMLAAIRAFDMLCPTCKLSTCRVVNLSKRYGELIKAVDADSLLPSAELGILQTLHNERRKMFANEIAAELDCSYQLVGRRSRNLAERALIERGKNQQGRREFAIRQEAESLYFRQDPGDALDYQIDGPSEGESQPN